MRLTSRTPLVAVLGGPMLLTSAAGFAQSSPARSAREDVYSGVVTRTAPASVGVFASIGLPRGEGLPLNGRFEVPFYAKLLTNGQFEGLTKFQACDGKRLLI